LDQIAPPPSAIDAPVTEPITAAQVRACGIAMASCSAVLGTEYGYYKRQSDQERFVINSVHFDIPSSVARNYGSIIKR